MTDVQGGTTSDCSAFACAIRKHIPLVFLALSVRSISQPILAQLKTTCYMLDLHSSFNNFLQYCFCEVDLELL